MFYMPTAKEESKWSNRVRHYRSADLLSQCDLKKPTCDACAKGKLVCGGYQREMIVIQVEAGKGAYKPQTKEVKRQVPIRLASMSDIRIRDLNRTAPETHCFTAFWKLYGSKDEPIGNWGPETKIHKTATRLMQYTYQHVPDSDKLRCALLALSVSKLGRANKDQALIKRGMELYGKAVAKVAFEIKHRPAFDKMEMLVTCRLLALYEVIPPLSFRSAPANIFIQPYGIQTISSRSTLNAI
jgi:hypothetical protein